MNQSKQVGLAVTKIKEVFEGNADTFATDTPEKFLFSHQKTTIIFCTKTQALVVLGEDKNIDKPLANVLLPTPENPGLLFLNHGLSNPGDFFNAQLEELKGY